MPKKSHSSKSRGRRNERDLDLQIRFLEGLVQRDPRYVDAWQVLGDCYTQRGRVEEGMKVDERLSQLQPADPVVHYNLACSYSLAGLLDNAAGALQRALDLGFRDFRWLAKDPDLRNLRQHPTFQNIRAQIRKIRVQ
jgi:tetratricopeptide (TPR) repeat protein